MAKKTTRTFEGTNRAGKVLSHTTSLTDLQAMNTLEDIKGEGEKFHLDCAFEILKMSRGRKGNPLLVAWGFKLADEILNPPKPLRLSEAIRACVRERRPLRDMVEAENGAGSFPFKVSITTSQNKHGAGHYLITDDGEWPRNTFYGMASPQGEWKPTRATPQVIIEELTK